MLVGVSSVQLLVSDLLGAVLWMLEKRSISKIERGVRNNTLQAAFECRSWRKMVKYWPDNGSDMSRYPEPRVQLVLGVRMNSPSWLGSQKWEYRL